MKRKTVFAGLAVFALGAALGTGLPQFYGAGPPPDEDVSAKESAVEHAIQHMDPNYVCPMHPQVVRDEPGSCPICGMDLVPVPQEPPPRSSMEKGSEGPPTITISPEVVNNMGVRTAPVERGDLAARIDTVGYVDYDESRLSHVHLRTEGWIERLYVDSRGERVSKGAPLLDLYSPALVNAQEEYIQARAGFNPALLRASRERLRALGLSAAQIEQLDKTRKVQQTITVLAPQSGVVAALNTPDGMYVKPASEIVALADLASVWVLAEVFEREAHRVRAGQAATVRIASVPDREWRGAVEYVYPDLDPRTRTLRVRLRFDNPGEVLKPNMYAHVSIFGETREDVMRIPREALIRTGRSQRVMVDLGDGRFRPREVTARAETDDWIEVVSGLKEGERVVVSGQFLIDSEASLRASLMRMGARTTAQDRETADGNGGRAP